MYLLISCLAETEESAGKLRYFAQIFYKLSHLFLLLLKLDVPRT